MKKKLIILTVIAVVIMVGIFIFIDKKMNGTKDDGVVITHYQQHVDAINHNVNTELGMVAIPEDHIVDESFESHLPLVVIDVNHQELPKSKQFGYNEDGDQVVLKREDDFDPFIYGSIYIVDNDNYDNKLSDAPDIESPIKIRLRGSSSQNFDKKQYAIKMLDEEGNSKAVDVMGMGENNDWILNISQIDGSLLRNYSAYMFGSALFEGTPDARYCEVFSKIDENNYEYLGLYLMLEKIEQGDDRLKISSYTPGDRVFSYLVCRDRENPNDLQISTYGDQEGNLYGRLSILYPDKEDIDEYAIDCIENEIDTIERVLYSDDIRVFNTWQEYLDKQSFVDFYVFNSIFRNYDAGNNSTYYYKNAGGKLCAGPVWDYDNACNNDYNAIQVPDYCYVYSRPWFERLVLSEDFVQAVEARYKELKSGIFNAEYINDYLTDVEYFLGNAALRDWSRWGEHYGEGSSYYSSYGLVDSQGFVVDRRTHSFEEEVLRYKSYFYLEEQYIEDNYRELEISVIDDSIYIGGYFAVFFVLIVVCAIILIRRVKMYR